MGAPEDDHGQSLKVKPPVGEFEIFKDVGKKKLLGVSHTKMNFAGIG